MTWERSKSPPKRLETRGDEETPDRRRIKYIARGAPVDVPAVP